MKTYLTILFFIGTCVFGYTQNSIKGTITDTENNPLFGVEIYAPDLHIGTTSNENGVYTLENIPHGELTIVFSYYGFESQIQYLDFHKDINNLNIQLTESVFNIDEVIISTPFNRLQSKNVMKVESSKVKAFKQKGAATLIDGLETMAGVSQISTGTSIGKPVIRGLSGNRVLIYAQGVRLENQQFGDEHGLGLNESGIESVEVIKGPASLLYGSDALGGVLYFNPERFATENTFSGNISQQYFSNTQGSNTNIGFKNSYEKWKFLVRGAYNSHIDYKVPNDDKVTNTRYNEINFNSGMSYNNQHFSSELRYNYNQSNVGLTEGIGEQTTDRALELPYQKINNHILSLHNHIYFDKSKLDIDFGYIYNDRNEFEDEHEGHEDEEDEEDHHEEEPSLQMKLKTFNYDAKYHFKKMKTLDLIVGIQGMHQTNKNFGVELLIPNAQINDVGILATGIIDIKENSLQAGVRFDSRVLNTEYHEVAHEDEIHVFEALNKSYNTLTASLGYKFTLKEKFTTRINLATGFRAPNLAELTSNGVHHGTNRFEIGNPTLRSEQNFQTDISLEYKSEHLEFFVNGFYNRLNDYIYLSPTGEVEDGADVYEYIQENAKLYGGEIGLHFHPHPLDWLHLESSYETVIGKQSNGNYLPLIPANQWNNTLRTTFKSGNWLTNGFGALTVSSTFQQDNVSNFETTTNGYTLVNIGVGGTINTKALAFEVTLNANNLFNKEYISHLSRLKVDNINNIGRNIILGINFEF